MSVHIDVLDDILNTIRLNGTVYFRKQFRGDWCIQTEQTPFKKFHVIVDGVCWLQADFLETPIELQQGDIVAFPHGNAYKMGSHLDVDGFPIDRLLRDPDQCEVMLDEGELAATVVFGHIEFTRDFAHPFTRDLPPLIHIRAAQSSDLSWLHAVANLIMRETSSHNPGSGSVVKRLAEVLHLYTLRAHILDHQGSGSFHAALRDTAIYRALQLIHSDPAENWTLDQIANQVNLSRTSFATRFRDSVGMPPMQYITMWRMQKARELLETTNQPLIAIALAVGYGSEAAFSRAFQREFGITPGRHRDLS